MSFSYYFTTSFCLSNIVCAFLDFVLPVFKIKKVDAPTMYKNYKKSFPLAITNLAISLPHLEISKYYLDQRERNDYYFITNLFWWLAISDILFYHMHRLCHTKWGYIIHKIHHEFEYTHGLSAFHAHPLDFLFSNLYPLILPVLFLKPPDYFVNFLCAVMVAYTIIISHGGYQFFNRSHLDHHLYRNKNYGLIVTDRVMGTKKLNNK